MFVFNLKFKKSKMLKPILAVCAIITAIICIAAMINVHNSLPNTATCDEIGLYSLGAKTKEEQLEFLNNFKIEADENSARARNVTIPCEFNEIYKDYNELQRQIGLDLEKFKGKNAQEITYTIKSSNYKFAVLLVCDDRIIGAHLTNGEYGCENEPLTKLWTDLTK